MQVGQHAVEVLSSNRRSFNRTWKRLRPLLELIVLARQGGYAGGSGSGCEKTITVEAGGSRPSRRISTIADIGCDHGILCVSLACMEWAASRRRGHNEEKQPRGSDGSVVFFSRVIGAHVSATALENGGLVLLEKMKEAMLPVLREGDGDPSVYLAAALPLDFRVGDGLAPVRHGEATGRRTLWYWPGWGSITCWRSCSERRTRRRARPRWMLSERSKSLCNLPIPGRSTWSSCTMRCKHWVDS